jgi:hypothetical protein
LDHFQAAHFVASNESENALFSSALVEWQNIFDLCIALWGKLSDDDGGGGGRDSHEATMMRRDAFSKWLENVVEGSVSEDLRKAQTSGDHIDQVTIYVLRRSRQNT